MKSQPGVHAVLHNSSVTVFNKKPKELEPCDPFRTRTGFLRRYDCIVHRTAVNSVESPWNTRPLTKIICKNYSSIVMSPTTVVIMYSDI